MQAYCMKCRTKKEIKDAKSIAMKRSTYYLYYHTLMLTGLRRSELLALKWRDLDLDLASVYVAHSLHRLDNGTVIIKGPKTPSSRRMVDLPPSLALLLRQHREGQQLQRVIFGWNLEDDDFVCSRMDGTSLNPNTVSHTFSKIVARAGLSHLRLHDLRHTYATLQRKAGQPIEVISRVLGHASEMVTLTIYNHWEGDLRAPADTMDLMLEKASQKQDEKTLVRNPLEDDEGIECRPYRSRTCDTLIKSQVLYQLS